MIEYLKSFNDDDFLKKRKKGRFDIIVNDIANSVEKARALSGLTQKNFSRKIGTSQSYVSRVENGTVIPSIKTLFKMSEAMKTYLVAPSFGVIIDEKVKKDLNNCLIKNSHGWVIHDSAESVKSFKSNDLDFITSPNSTLTFN